MEENMKLYNNKKKDNEQMVKKRIDTHLLYHLR